MELLKGSKIIKSMLLTIVLSAVITFSLLASASNKDLSQLAGGKPNLISQNRLGMEQYLSFEVGRLANAQLLWVNVGLLREMGYEISEQPSVSERAKLLDVLGWVSIDKYIQPGEITDERRTMLADFYGGGGIGDNTGSARAGSTGDVQIKGVGITPHLRTTGAQYTARSTIHESIKDAVWGEVLNNELAYGANRIVAILDRGTMENGEPQILEVRVDPVRMGQFLMRKTTSDKADAERSLRSSIHLEKNLPAPPGGFPRNATKGERLRLGMNEFSRRIGNQYARMYMLRLFHGAVTQSNILIDGSLIDFGTSSSQPGYEGIKFLDIASPFGPIDGINRVLNRDFVSFINFSPEMEAALEKTFSNPRWRLFLADEMRETFQNAYEKERKLMSLKTLGIPADFADKLLAHHDQVAQELVALTETEWRQNTEYVRLNKVETLKGRAVGRIQALAENVLNRGNFEGENIFHAIQTYYENSADARRVSVLLSNLYKEAIQMGDRGGVIKGNFVRLMKENSKFLNAPIDALYLPDLRKTTHEVTERYMNGDHGLPGSTIEKIVSRSVRSVKGLKWWQAPTLVHASARKESKVEIFDARLSRDEQSKTESLSLHQRPKVAPSCRIVLQ